MCSRAYGVVYLKDDVCRGDSETLNTQVSALISLLDKSLHWGEEEGEVKKEKRHYNGVVNVREKGNSKNLAQSQMINEVVQTFNESKK